MPLSIRLKSCLVFPGLDSDRTTLPESVLNVRDLLAYLGEVAGCDFITDKPGELGGIFEVYINGKEIWFWEKGLDYPIESDDLVEIRLIFMGGG